jgi:ppGpp synthetase/RelA/SpoT-type nucleotidyltranferase
VISGAIKPAEQTTMLGKRLTPNSGIPISDMGKKYTGKQVSKAGEDLLDIDRMLKDNEKFEAALDVLSYWRFSHEVPLSIAFGKLQEVALKKDKNAIFAKRLKRFISIVRKLDRFRSMKLKNMQDIGGCRAILASEKKLNQIARELKKMPEFRHDGKYRIKNYIKNPKDDGYRSFHIVGKFPDADGDSKNIEIQLRTSLQHYWATALEIVDLFTDQALKSNQGNAVWKSFFKLVSDQFAIMDSIHMFNTLSPYDKFERYIKILQENEDMIICSKKIKQHCDHLNVLKMLIAFSNSLKIIENKLDNHRDKQTEFVLLKIDTLKKTVYSELFTKEESKIAEGKYVEAEKEAASRNGVVAALVSTTAVGGIREAYPNYFADSTEFAKHLQLIIEASRRAYTTK